MVLPPPRPPADRNFSRPKHARRLVSSLIAFYLLSTVELHRRRGNCNLQRPVTGAAKPPRLHTAFTPQSSFLAGPEISYLLGMTRRICLLPNCPVYSHLCNWTEFLSYNQQDGIDLTSLNSGV